MKYSFSINDFKESLNIGHEIEFVFAGDMFFIQPDYEFIKSNNYKQNVSEIKFILYRCKNWYDNNAEILLSGTYDEIIEFPLKDNLTIKTDFDKFQVHCIL